MSETVLDGVRDLLPQLRDRAEEAERLRRVPDASMKALAQTGFFRLLQPRRYDGFEADPMDFYTAVRLIAAACGSTGWVASVLGVHPWQLALFPEAAQQAVWGGSVDTRMSSSYAPTGRATAVPGGYRLTGRWSFSSGCDHASWVLLGGLVTGEDGKVLDFKTFLLPRADYAIDDVWHTVGLCGTGSNDIVVDERFVPDDHTLSMTESGRCEGPGQAVNTAALYRLPFHAVFTNTITVPIIGIATGGYQAHVAMQRARVRAAYAGQKSIDDPFAKVRIARAASEIDAAWLQLESGMREMTALAAAGEKIPLRLRLRVRRDQVIGTGRAIDAIDALFENSGGRALASGTYLQRAWRDAHAGRAHAANDPERALLMFGTVEFGQRVEPGMY